jgi:hypothetical protein
MGHPTRRQVLLAAMGSLAALPDVPRLSGTAQAAETKIYVFAVTSIRPHVLQTLLESALPGVSVTVFGRVGDFARALEDAPPDAAPKDEEATGKVSVATVVDPAWRKPVTIGAFAVGGAGIVVGSVFGIVAMSKHNSLATDCRAKTCYPDQKSQLDSFHTAGMISTIGFVAGGVGIAGGVVLLLVKPQSLVQQQPADQSPQKTSFRWSPFVGIGSAGLEGTF